MGRFLTRDSWHGDYDSPQSLNRWMYVGGNPINRTDPSGNCWYPNLQHGGISVDAADPSTGMCPWFLTAMQQNGISIPTDATRDNWMDHIPASQRSILYANIGCLGNLDYPSLQALPYESYAVIKFYTNPKWEYFQTVGRKTPSLSLRVLGVGGEAYLACDNFTRSCSVNTQIDGALSLGNVLGFELGVSLGMGSEKNIYTGSIVYGGTMAVGPFDLFVSMSKVSVGSSDAINFWEVGWSRPAPQQYWVLAKQSAFRSIGYEQFADLYLGFQGSDKIYYRVEAVGKRDSLFWAYRPLLDSTFE